MNDRPIHFLRPLLTRLVRACNPVHRGITPQKFNETLILEEVTCKLCKTSRYWQKLKPKWDRPVCGCEEGSANTAARVCPLHFPQ